MKYEKTLSGVFINSIDGCLIEVTNYQGALQQAKDAVRWHDERKKIVEDYMNPDHNNIIYFAEAHKTWNHNLLQLEKLAIQTPSLANF